MRVSGLSSFCTSAFLVIFLCCNISCTSVRLHQTADAEDEELSEEEKEDDVEKVAEELEEQTRRDSALELKLEHARELAEEAEIAEENAEDAVAKAALEKEQKDRAESPDRKLEAMMQELINVAYKLREVNQKLAILD